MSDYATKNDVQEIVKEAVTDLSEVIGNLAQSMHNELDDIKLEQREIKRSIDRLTNTIDGFVARIDRYETEQTARDAQFERLLEWAREVSKKTGIPLRDL